MDIIRYFNIILYLICFQVYRLYMVIFRKPKSNIKLIAIQTPAYEGNLLAIANKLKLENGIRLYWISYANKDFLKKLKQDGWEAYSDLDITKIPLFYNTQVYIGTIGLGNIPTKYFKPGKWIDMDHAIIEKKERIIEKYRFDYIFVTSDFIKSCFDKYGLGDKVIITGFPKTDFYFNNKREFILKELEFAINKKYVLYAPTWEQNNSNIKSFFPGGSLKKNLDLWQNFAIKNNVIFLLRPHKNWRNNVEKQQLEQLLTLKKYSNIKYVSFKLYPRIEYFLQISDVLVADWGGVITDFAPLNKPIIRFDLPQAYISGFGDIQHKMGKIIKFVDFLNTLRMVIFINRLKHKGLYNLEDLYGKNNIYFDGNSTKRCVNFILGILQ